MKPDLKTLPPAWQWQELGEVATLINGRAYKDDELLESGPVPVLRVGNFFSNRSWYYSDLQLPEEKYCNKGDLLYAWSASFGPKIWEGEKAIFHYHIWKIVTSPLLDKKYLYYLLASESANIKSAGNGIAMMHATKGGMEKRKIPLPPLVDQQKIASILDAADSLRQKDQQLVERYTALSQSLFLEMFGDPVTNPMGWECKSLESITSKIGSGSTPRGGKEAYIDEGISLIRSLNIHDNNFLMKNLAFIDDKQADELANVTVEENDVLLNITGASVCRCAIVPTEVLPARVNQHVSILRCNTIQANPYYLLHLIISAQFKQKLLNIAGANGATREALTKSQLSELNIPTPSIALQNQFAERIQLIEAQKQQAQRSLEKSEALFNSLLQRAFTGELTAKMAA